ncbi:MAG TPA: acyltransferase family protein [Chroococcidiopsis sp.]
MAAELQAKSAYRPEIDGLRALAVVAVIINHFNKEILPSGYLGVDIFFVISGFVITSSLAGRPSKNFGDFITGFYVRRIKRLVPALAVFVVVTSILIGLFNPDPEASLSTGIAALFGLSNLFLLQQSTDYFAASTELNVFLHTWSLGVEEQFYFLFPFLVWFTGFSRLAAKGARNLFWLTGMLSVASLVAFVYFYQANQPAAYFLMPTRLWELGAGCLLLLGLKQPNRFRVLQRMPPALVTVAILGVFFIPLQFAVEATVAAVLLTLILIASLRSGTAAYAFFTYPSVIYIGLISYSLYLWHWSVLSISRWTIGIHWWSVPFQVALMLLLAIASYRYVETPLRRSDWSSVRWRSLVYGIAASGTAALILLGLLLPFKGMLYTGSNSLPDANSIPTEIPCPAAAVTNDRHPKFLIVGDSHAAHLSPLFDNTPLKCMVSRETMSVTIFPVLYSRISDRPDYPVKPRALARVRDRVGVQYQQKIDALTKGDVLVVSSRYLCRLFSRCFSLQLFDKYNQFFDDDLHKISEEDVQNLYITKLVRLGEELKARGIKVVVFLPTPEIRQSPEMCKREWFRPWPPSGCSVAAETLQARQKIVGKFRSRVPASAESNIYFYDGFSRLCGSNAETGCQNISDNPSLLSDATHIGLPGARLLYDDFYAFLRQNDMIKTP